ncbi:transposable element Tcb1 transposase [Trichonephila clavipes]|nr:transposable element Tcb1 transposase [Trichonephila clavipes]
MSRRKQRSAFGQVSEFDRGRIVAYRDCGLSFREIGSRVGRNQITVMRICDRWMQEAYNALLKYPIYFAYSVHLLELIGNIREFIIPKKTPKNISGKVLYRFVTIPRKRKRDLFEGHKWPENKLRNQFLNLIHSLYDFNIYLTIGYFTNSPTLKERKALRPQTSLCLT